MSAAALAVSLLLVLVPGLGASLALHRPGALGLAARLALVPVLGTVVAGLVAFALAIAGLLSTVSLVIGLVLVTAGLWAAALRRGSLRDHVRAAGEDLRDDPWGLGIGIAVIVAFALVRLAWPSLLHFTSPTAWRYWADAVEIADAGRVPEATLQYGRLLEPTVNKVFLNGFGAAVALTAGAAPLPALGALLWLSSVGFAMALWAVGRELGLRLLAPLLPLALLANRRFLNTELTTDLDTYKAEIVGRMLAFGGLLLLVRALRGMTGRERGSLRPPADALVGGAILGVAATVHVVPVVIAVLAAVGFGVALVVRERARPAVLAAGAAAALAVVAVAATVLVVSGGDPGLRGAAGDQAYRERFGSDFDPTLYVNAGVAPERQTAEPGRWRVPPGQAVERFARASLRVEFDRAEPPSLRPVTVVAALAALVLAVAMLVWFPRPLRELGVVAWTVAGGIVALTVAFSYRSELYIPAYFGLRRLFDYASVPAVLLVLGVAEGGLAAVGIRRRWLPGAAAAVAAVLVALLVLPGAPPPDERRARAERVMEPLAWIAENVPCDARLLVSQQTEGVFQAALGRVAVLEGMTPYLRPEILERTVGRFLDARAFFRDPGANADFPSRLGASHVVVLRAGGVGYPAMIGKVDVDALDAAPFLEAVHRSDAAIVYRVREAPGRGEAPDLPDPDDAPGYHCRRSLSS